MSAALAWLVVLALDGGVDAGARWLSPEDEEVVENLDLLQELDSAADLELLQELE